MNKYFYDLHIHSCLSPCADNDMTPENIAGMAALLGLNIVALTDHNSTKNCRAFFSAAKRHGIVPVAGMEMTTAEDVHIVCLFPTLEAAEEFDAEYQKYRVLYKNRTDIFGDQLIMGEGDELIGTEENLLLNASTLSISDAVGILSDYGAAVFPAHIDREENGIISMLGSLPDSPRFRCVEFNDSANIPEYKEKHGLDDRLILTNSDAHYLWNINEAENSVMLEDEPYSSAHLRGQLISLIRGK
ncbi:MAG: PHP domain-containing protein [Eubacteriales bacterium]